MKIILHFGIALMMLCHATAYAQTSVPDVDAGQRRAAVCFACHNADGVTRMPGVPNLAGQQRDYLESALRAYRDGKTRQNQVMNAMAQPLSDPDIVNIAAYFSLRVAGSGSRGTAQAQ